MNITEILALIASAYEILSYAIPTEKNYSIVHKVGKALVFVSNFLNRKKKIDPFKTLSIAFAVVTMFYLFAACKTIEKVECLSKKTVPVTFVTKSGYPYTVNIPYCDTIQLKDNVIDTTIKL